MHEVWSVCMSLIRVVLFGNAFPVNLMDGRGTGEIIAKCAYNLLAHALGFPAKAARGVRGDNGAGEGEQRM